MVLRSESRGTVTPPPLRGGLLGTAFHGLRVGGLRRAGAPPVATFRRPCRGEEEQEGNKPRQKNIARKGEGTKGDAAHAYAEP